MSRAKAYAAIALKKVCPTTIIVVKMTEFPIERKKLMLPAEPPAAMRSSAVTKPKTRRKLKSVGSSGNRSVMVPNSARCGVSAVLKTIQIGTKVSRTSRISISQVTMRPTPQRLLSTLFAVSIAGSLG